MAIDLNQPAPDFTLYRAKGETLSLSSLRGTKVVLAFFPAAFTGVCQKELCTFRDSFAELSALNATVVGISVDGLFSNLAFAQQNGIGFPILSDYERKVVNAYGIALPDFAGLPGYVASKRAVFVVDENGMVIYTWVAPNPGIEPNYAEIKAALA